MKETTIDYIDLQRIRPSNTNPRKHFDEDYIGELSDSIRTKGILQPLLARPDWCIGKSDEEIAECGVRNAESANGNGANGVKFFEIVAGECRFRGAVKAGLTEAPAIVRLLSDRETLEIQLIENLQRSDLTPIEEAQAYRRLIDEMGYTVKLIHEKTGKAIKTIYGKLTMLNAPKVMLEGVDKGVIGERLCELVGRIPVKEAREQAAREILHPKFLREDAVGRLEVAPEQPLSYRLAADLVRENYMRSLSKADFDQADALLVVPIVDDGTGERIGGGACTDCPMKTGNRPELLGDFKRADLCTNPKCFAQKTDAHFARLQATAAAEGKKILSAEEARDIFEDDKGRLWFDSPYVKLSEQPDSAEVEPGLKRIPSWRKLLENVESKPQIVIARDPKGRVVELVDRALAIEAIKLAAKQKGEKSIFDMEQRRAGSRSAGSSDEGPEPEWKKQDRKNREIAKMNFQITLAVMTALMEAIDKKGAVKGFWDALIEASITHAGHDGAWLMCKRLGLDAKKGKWKDGVATEGVEGAVLEYGLALPEEAWKLGFVVELLLSQRAKFSGNSYGGGLKHVHVLKSFLDLYKIDVAAIEKQVKVDGRVKASPRGNGKKNLSGGVESRNADSGSSPPATLNTGPKDGGANGSSAPSAQKSAKEAGKMPALQFAKHKWENIAGNKYHCLNCGAAAVKNVKKEIVPMNEFRGKPCVSLGKAPTGLTKGWGVTDSKRSKPQIHYFVDSKSLCRGTLAKEIFGDKAPGSKCRTCNARLEKPKRVLTAADRKRLGEIMKARWAAQRAKKGVKK